jgi:hypothetical protein
MREGQPAPLAVTAGATDGRMTQVVAGELRPGMEVLTDVAPAAP